MELKDIDYQIQFDESSKIMKFNGSIRLQNLPAYEPIKNFLKEAGSKSDGALITLDFTTLQFVNSSGITTLSMFIIESRKNANYKVAIKGSSQISWQAKSLANFQKLWDSVTLEIV